MVYVGIWLLFGVFSAMLASGKNRSVAGWFFIGALFGPFGLLVAAMPAEEEGAMEGENHPNKINDMTLICVTEDNNDWESAKSQLREKLASQGLELEVVDNEKSYMLKKSSIDNEYVMLQKKNGAIYIEFNSVPEVVLPLAKQYQEQLNQEDVESHTTASWRRKCRRQ